MQTPGNPKRHDNNKPLETQLRGLMLTPGNTVNYSTLFPTIALGEHIRP